MEKLKKNPTLKDEVALIMWISWIGLFWASENETAPWF